MDPTSGIFPRTSNTHTTNRLSSCLECVFSNGRTRCSVRLFGLLAASSDEAAALCVPLEALLICSFQSNPHLGVKPERRVVIMRFPDLLQMVCSDRTKLILEVVTLSCALEPVLQRNSIFCAIYYTSCPQPFMVCVPFQSLSTLVIPCSSIGFCNITAELFRKDLGSWPPENRSVDPKVGRGLRLRNPALYLLGLLCGGVNALPNLFLSGPDSVLDPRGR